MIKFSEFMAERADIRLVAFHDDGTVVIYIDGKRYEYVVDTVHKDRIKVLSRRAPGRALNLVKKLSKKAEDV